MFIGKLHSNYVVLLTIPEDLSIEWYDIVDLLPEDLLMFLGIPDEYELASTVKVKLGNNFSDAWNSIRRILKETAEKQTPKAAPSLIDGTPREELLTADNLDRQVSVSGDEVSINMLRQLEKSAEEKYYNYDRLVTSLSEQLDKLIDNKEQWQSTLKQLVELGKFYEKQRLDKNGIV